MEIMNIVFSGTITVFNKNIKVSIHDVDCSTAYEDIMKEINIIQDIVVMIQQTPEYQKGDYNFNHLSLEIRHEYVLLFNEEETGYYTQDSLESYLEDCNILCRL